MLHGLRTRKTLAHLSSLSLDGERHRGDDHLPGVQARERADDADERLPVLLHLPLLLGTA